MAQELTGQRVAEVLRLAPHPEEGGQFAETFRDQASTAIYYLLSRGEISPMHRLGTRAEVFHHYAGAPMQMLHLHPDGSHDEPVLGPDLAAGQRPQIVIPAGVWQGASPLGDWSLVGCTVAPPFEFADFAHGDRDELIAGWPDTEARIRDLTQR